jgi:hypothetical protein
MRGGGGGGGEGAKTYDGEKVQYSIIHLMLSACWSGNEKMRKPTHIKRHRMCWEGGGGVGGGVIENTDIEIYRDQTHE